MQWNTACLWLDLFFFELHNVFVLCVSHLRVVLNGSSQEEVCVRDIRILPNFNASYLPMMPDGSVLLVDNVWYDQGTLLTRQSIFCALFLRHIYTL